MFYWRALLWKEKKEIDLSSWIVHEILKNDIFYFWGERFYLIEKKNSCKALIRCQKNLHYEENSDRYVGIVWYTLAWFWQINTNDTVKFNFLCVSPLRMCNSFFLYSICLTNVIEKPSPF